MTNITSRQIEQIRILADPARTWNWHNFARYWFNNHDTDSLELGFLISEGLIEEVEIEGEDHKQIRSTRKGKKLINYT